jgi:hypothetical protein
MHFALRTNINIYPNDYGVSVNFFTNVKYTFRLTANRQSDFNMNRRMKTCHEQARVHAPVHVGGLYYWETPLGRLPR